MTNTKYNLNKIDPITYLNSFKDEDGNTVYFSNYNSSTDSSFPPTNNVNPLEVLKNFYLPKLRKKFQRPYFSPYHNNLEMDYVILPYPDKQKRVDKRHYLFYLFMININIKYLVVSFGYTKDAKHIVDVLKYIKYYFNIEHVKGDYGRCFIARKTYKYLNENGIRYYFTRFKYTNRNRVVDRVIRIIKDMVDKLVLSASLLNEEFLQQVVHLYNHTKHCAYNSKFTPAQAQYNPEVETWIICKQESKLGDIDLSPF
jgi:hypothetical protein